MPGFMCYVQGRLDPVEFFYGLNVTFSEAPHLAHLKRSVEEEVLGNNLIPNGSDYIVGDLEILDFRLNEWVHLNSRGQLYSGCHIAAIRDMSSGTCAGPFEVVKKPMEAKVLGFALQAKEIYDSLDAENEGVLRLKSVLKSLRHDVNYAVDIFSKFDVRATGSVTYTDFKSVFNSLNRATIEELRERLKHGGRPLQGHDGSIGGYASSLGLAGSHGSAGGGGGGAAGLQYADADELSSALGGIPVVGLKGKIKPQSLHATPGDGGIKPPTGAKMDKTAGAMDTSSATGPAASPVPRDSSPVRDDDDEAAAKKVVALLQKSITKKREAANPGGSTSGGGTLAASVVSKLKGLSKKSSASPPAAAKGGSTDAGKASSGATDSSDKASNAGSNASSNPLLAALKKK